MVQEMRIYRIKIGGLAEYLRHFEEIGLPIARRHMFLAGFWTVETGEINELYHLWSFRDLIHRTEIRARLRADPDWQRDFMPKALTLVEAQRNVILTPTSFSPGFNCGLPESP